MIAFQRANLAVFRQAGRIRLLLLLGVGLGLICVSFVNNTPQRHLADGFTFPPPLVGNHSAEVATSSNVALIEHTLISSPSHSPIVPTSEASALPECPPSEKITTFLKKLPKSRLLIENLQEAEIQALHPDLKPGGEWKPADCRARSKVAVIIPYRDRKSHLTRLLDFLIPIMKRQLLDFRFIVTEQSGDDLFNKGRIMNAAFRLAESMGVQCTIFHDVDMFPLDDRIPYGCPNGVLHMGAWVDTLGFNLLSKELVGGVLNTRMEAFRKVNGYSNEFFGWGGEDDELGRRFSHLNFTIERVDPTYARYTMLKHQKRHRTSPKMIDKLVATAGERYKTDGVNQESKWTVLRLEKRPLYSHLMVDVGKSPPYWRKRF